MKKTAKEWHDYLNSDPTLLLTLEEASLMELGHICTAQTNQLQFQEKLLKLLDQIRIHCERIDEGRLERFEIWLNLATTQMEFPIIYPLTQADMAPDTILASKKLIQDIEARRSKIREAVVK